MGRNRFRDRRQVRAAANQLELGQLPVFRLVLNQPSNAIHER
jgi:hypothetical protein